MIFRSASAFSSWNPCPPDDGGRAAPCGRSSAGTCSGAITSPSDAMIIRSTMFRSSRTLFRRHSYAINRSRASAAIFFRRIPKRAQIPVRNWSTSSGMSESRSRSGGTLTVWTASRK